MEGVFEVSELKLIEKYNLIVTVCNSKQLGWLLDNTFNKPVDVFVKYDSGMGRLGFQGEEFINAINLLEENEKIGQITLMTHFSSADDINSTSTNEQISNFDKTLYSKKYSASLANSAAIMSLSESHREYTRPGIMLYGSSPFPEKTFLNKLTPAMTLSSVLISIKSFKAGQSIGYGCRYICKQDTLIGVVAIGYADGYPRSAEDGTPVYINGVKSKIAGRVSMDMITIDLTGVPNPQIGDCVELFGENISIDEVAEHCSTISYEIFTKITNRVYKSYV